MTQGKPSRLCCIATCSATLHCAYVHCGSDLVQNEQITVTESSSFRKVKNGVSVLGKYSVLQIPAIGLSSFEDLRGRTECCGVGRLPLGK